MKKHGKNKNKKSSNVSRKTQSKRARGSNKTIKRKSFVPSEINDFYNEFLIESEYQNETENDTPREVRGPKRKTDRELKSYLEKKIRSKSKRLKRKKDSDEITTRKIHLILLKKSDQFDLTNPEERDLGEIYLSLIHYLPTLHKKIKRNSEAGLLLEFFDGEHLGRVSASSRLEPTLKDLEEQLYIVIQNLLTELKRYQKARLFIVLRKIGLREYITTKLKKRMENCR